MATPGAQPGNTSAMRFGLRTDRVGLALVVLGPRYKTVDWQTRRLRKALEAQVRAAKGKLSIADAATINRVCRLEALAQIASKKIRVEGEADKIPETEVLRAVAYFTEKRDLALARLTLIGDDDGPGPAPVDLWEPQQADDAYDDDSPEQAHDAAPVGQAAPADIDIKVWGDDQR